MFSKSKSTPDADGLRHGGARLERHWPLWRRVLAFFGPGYLVAVGYMIREIGRRRSLAGRVTAMP